MFNLFTRKVKSTIFTEQREFICRDAGFLPFLLAAKRDISIKQLGTAYQMHPQYDPAKHPNHPRIGVARTNAIIERHNYYRAGVNL